MWLKWLPWKFILTNSAKKHGFVDPIDLISKLQNFSEPSEVAAPLELLRAGVVFHARGLINSQAIQHNLDWIWPYWVECQFNPNDKSFVPRAFSVTHINLTHRNWTAVGMPDNEQLPIVDPRGLVTPFLDGWSIDAWIINDDGSQLIPSKSKESEQKLIFQNNLMVTTETKINGAELHIETKCEIKDDNLYCCINVKASSINDGWLAIVLRPYNPEGISFIHQIKKLNNYNGFEINEEHNVRLDKIPDKYLMSDYKRGDVHRFLNFELIRKTQEKEEMICNVGMATAAALYRIDNEKSQEVHIEIPITNSNKKGEVVKIGWDESIEDSCRLDIPDKKFQFLYDAAIRTLVLHSPNEVYPGPYTYKRFWFRDAAFITYSLLCAGFTKRAKRVLDIFPTKQTVFGYFLSQEGEWDSNGQSLWIFNKYCLLTGEKPDEKWKKSIIKGANWILRKRLSNKIDSPCAGLFPAGFSAEHLGPNDYYYWDDFWGIAGLNAAGNLMKYYNEDKLSEKYYEQANDFSNCLERSLEYTRKSLNRLAIPAAPYRRMDAGAIGSIAGGYPLDILLENDKRLLDTVNFLYDNCMFENGFFQDMTHSGINPYLTLHIAQIFLRAGDTRYLNLMQAVADLASPTGQWPEAVHPITKGGCMGDGQHVWAAAEWILMIKNCFVREGIDKLILCSGIPINWIDENQILSFGPVLTSFGKINVKISCDANKINICWDAVWHNQKVPIEIQLPGHVFRQVEKGQCFAELIKKDPV